MDVLFHNLQFVNDYLIYLLSLFSINFYDFQINHYKLNYAFLQHKE